VRPAPCSPDLGRSFLGSLRSPDKRVSQPIHQIVLVVNGIHLLENLKLDELAAKRMYEFAFMLEPLKLQRATGSTVAPAAVR
jgi:kynurenine formamidase